MKCLNYFCEASSQKVSKPKSRLLKSNNVHRSEDREMSRVAGIWLTRDLGKYLGVPLLHKRPTRADFDFILERTMKRLSSWKASSLSLAGRVTLAKSVISAIPSYCMQTMLLPKGVCDVLDKLQRGFLWGKERRVSKSCQVG